MLELSIEETKVVREELTYCLEAIHYSSYNCDDITNCAIHHYDTVEPDRIKIIQGILRRTK